MGPIILAALVAIQVSAYAETFKVLTLNVAGIPLVHPRLSERLAAIAAELKTSGYDLVALQEAWRDRDADTISIEAGFPALVRYRRRLTLGTGLALLSRHAPVEAEQRRFTSRPSALRHLQGESLVNKGVIFTRIKTPQGELDVYDTHLIANYKNARYFTLRLTQILELSELILERSAKRPVLLLGDINATPENEEYAILTDLLGLEDPCRPAGREICGASNGEGRLDHILLPRGARPLKASVRLAMTGALPSGTPYSDHAGVEAVFDLERLLSRRLNPDLKRRAAALARIEAAIVKMMETMVLRQSRRFWLPVYGFGMTLRYDHQLNQLLDIKARAETARLKTLQMIR